MRNLKFEKKHTDKIIVALCTMMIIYMVLKFGDSKAMRMLIGLGIGWILMLWIKIIFK